MLQKNDIVELTITSMTNEAFGIGRCDGVAVFVPMSAVGDVLKVRIVKVLKSYCFGVIEEILTPSPNRIEVDCPVYRQCGGCSLRHISYDSECEIKNNWVYENLRRIGSVEIEPTPIIASELVDGYRNKAQYPVAQGENGVDIGFYARRSHRVIPHKNCLLQPEKFSALLDDIEAFLNRYKVLIYDESTGKGLVRHIYIRHAESSGKLMLCLVINGRQLPHSGQFVTMITQKHPEICSIILNVNRANTNVILGPENILLFGTETITDTLCGVDISISPQAFYQVNRRGAEKLYAIAKEFANLSPDDVVLDLYCGAGTIGLSFASEAKEIIGVEIVPQAVDNARQSAKMSGIENAKFICATADSAAADLKDEGVEPNVVVIDPPRKGCTPELIEKIAEIGPERVIYVSCNSSTLARDVKLFSELGYAVNRVQAVDMFPRTAHVECVVAMSRQEQ